MKEETRPEVEKEESVGKELKRKPDRKWKKRNQSGKNERGSPTGSGKRGISRERMKEEVQPKTENTESAGK